VSQPFRGLWHFQAAGLAPPEPEFHPKVLEDGWAWRWDHVCNCSLRFVGALGSRSCRSGGWRAGMVCTGVRCVRRWPRPGDERSPPAVAGAAAPAAAGQRDPGGSPGSGAGPRPRLDPVATPARRGVKLRQLEPSVAVRGLHHRDLCPDALEPHHAVHPTALDRPLALQLESELDEERRRGREVVDHDDHVLHALDRHALDCSDTTAPATASLGCRSAGGNAPPIGLKRPAMSCSAQSGHSWVRETMEDAQ